ncbi:hypothetical protein, partial [Loigolactobacillus coryniformis]|uniref:hypothetical protein n=1 Tax=Loigolactobacillus coryniformis TaxID=1610 RepID=UPI000219670F
KYSSQYQWGLGIENDCFLLKFCARNSPHENKGFSQLPFLVERARNPYFMGLCGRFSKMKNGNFIKKNDFWCGFTS